MRHVGVAVQLLGSLGAAGQRLEDEGHLFGVGVGRKVAVGERADRPGARRPRHGQRVAPEGPTLVMAIVHPPGEDAVEYGFGAAMEASLAGASGGQGPIGLITEPATAVVQVQGAVNPTTELGVATYARVDRPQARSTSRVASAWVRPRRRADTT